MDSNATKVILIMNLGSPDSTSVKDVRRYLNEFLMDERVIDIPKIPRALLVKGIIVPFRAPSSAKAYRSIWTKDGSPLIHLTYQLQNALQKSSPYPVEVCMRYGNPTPEVAYQHIQQKYPNVEEVILFPLYPHYAMSSYETAMEYAKEIHTKNNYPFTLSVVDIFYTNEAYIHALSESIAPHLKDDYDLLLFSYHGIPKRHVKKTDPTKKHCLNVADCCNVDSEAHQYCYRHQVFMTSSLVAAELQLPKEKYATSFQSRLGRDEWLKPYTAARLKELPKEGIKKIVVVCPAFVSDCLETIEEMGEEGREFFMEAGGESFTLIPCLNTTPLWIKAMNLLIENHLQKNTINVPVS